MPQQPFEPDPHKPEIRVVKIRYRSGVNGRVAIAFAKVPYGGLFDLTEKMTRLLARHEVRWFRIEPASPDEIGAARETLQRWPDALRGTLALTRINLDV